MVVQLFAWVCPWPWQAVLSVVGPGRCARQLAPLHGTSCGPVRRPHTAWQVLHGERSMYNARGGWDLARFLADADRDDVEAHLANLRCGSNDVGGLLLHCCAAEGFCMSCLQSVVPK